MYRRSETLGGFPLHQTLDVAQLQDRSVRLRKFSNLLLEDSRALDRRIFFLRGWPMVWKPSDRLRIAFVEFIVCRGYGDLALAAPQFHERGVHHNTVKPGGELRTALKLT